MTADQFCVFEVAQHYYAVSATQIREITAKPDFSKAPCSTLMLAGIWHEGSEFLPVLRMPFQSSISEKESQVLVIHGQNGRWALLVDQVHNIVPLECSQGNQGESNEWNAALQGMATWKGRPVRVMNLDGLYRLIEAQLQDEWNGTAEALTGRETLEIN